LLQLKIILNLSLVNCFFYLLQVIRSEVSDVRERLYNKKGIDCYMFRIDQDIVVDATMNGNSSRFINHSCEVNISYHISKCYVFCQGS